MQLRNAGISINKYGVLSPSCHLRLILPSLTCALGFTQNFFSLEFRTSFSQDLISNSPYFLTYTSLYVSLENLVLHQLKILELIFFSILITSMHDAVLIL